MKNKRMKKLIALIVALIIAMPSILIMPSVYAETSAYDLISAKSYDRALSVSGTATFQDLENRVGAVWYNGYLAYPGIDFGTSSPVRVEATAGSRAGHATEIKIMIDDPASEPIAIVPITIEEFAVGHLNSAALLKKVTGVHTVYITTVSSTMNFFSFQFYGLETDKPTYNLYEGKSNYSDLSGAYADSVDMLMQLGLMNFEGTEFSSNLPVTRGEFAQAAYGIYVDTIEEEEIKAEKEANGEVEVISTKFTDVGADNQYAKAISYLSQRGVMNGINESEFKPGRFISLIDAVTVIVRILGYKELAEEEGGYPYGYAEYGTKLKLASGGIDIDKILNRGDFVSLLYSALEAKFLVPVGVKEDYVEHETKEGILSDTQNVYYATGTVEATPYTTLGMPESELGIKEVIIDGNVYNIGRTNAIGMLGFECEFYYEENDGNRVLRGIVPDSSCEYTDILSSNDEVLSISNSKIVYIPSGESEEEEIKLDENARVIYNGVASDTDFENSFESKENFTGRIRVINNDSNDSQVLMIEEYKDFVVESISADKTGIVGDGGEKKIFWSEDDYVIIEDVYGITVKFANIALDSVITYYESNNQKGKKLIRIYVGESDFTGKVNKIENNKIYIDNVEYKFSNNVQKPKVGAEAKFLLNIYNDVVAIRAIEPDTWQIGLYMNYSNRDMGFDNDVKVKLISGEGVVKTFDVANVLVADGIKIRDTKDMLNGVDGFDGIANMETESVIRYRINSENKLSSIDTAETIGEKSTDDSLTCAYSDYSGNISFGYNQTFKLLVENRGSTSAKARFYAPKNATTFVFYGEDGQDRENSCIVNNLSAVAREEDVALKGVKLYSTTGSPYVVDAVVWRNGMLSGKMYAQKSPFVYSSYSEGVNAEGDPTIIIKGWQGGGMVEYTFDPSRYTDGSTIKLIEDKLVRPGDVLNIIAYPDNTLYQTKPKLFTDGEATRDGYAGSVPVNTSVMTTGTGLGTREVYGRVIDRDGEFVVLQVGEQKDEYGNATPIIELVNVEGLAVCRVSKREDDNKYFIESKESNNIQVGDVIYCSYLFGRFEILVVYDLDDLKFSFDK